MAMNSTPGQNTLFHTLARMLPAYGNQSAVYRHGEKFPPGFEDGFGPVWEAVPFILAGRQTQQARVNLQREFHLLAVAGSSGAAGGFRLQLYDSKKQLRLGDRGISFNNLLGPGSAPFFLREPYPLTEKNAQLLVIAQNQDPGNNTIQVVLYGLSRRFNHPA